MKKLGETENDFFKKPRPDGKALVPMTLEEAVEKTLSVTAGIRARAGRATPTPAAPAAAPAQRPLMSRPQVQTSGLGGVPLAEPAYPVGASFASLGKLMASPQNVQTSRGIREYLNMPRE